MSGRTVGNTRMTDADRLRAALWRQNNRERHIAANTAYNRAHKVERAAHARRRYAALKPIVYAWVTPDGVADYVGRGTAQRPWDHRDRSTWWTPQHTLLTMTCDSEWQAMEYEGIWGARYLPRHNKEGYRHAGS